MKINVSTSGYTSLGVLVMFLFNTRTVAHVFHLKTAKFAEHKALNEFYDAIVGFADRFAEAAIGAFGPIEDFPQTVTLDIPENYVAFFFAVRDTLTEEMKRPEIALHKDLENIITEVLELCNQTIYKLEHLH